MQTRCPNCSATLSFTQQGTVCELTCPHCNTKLIATAPSFEYPDIDLDWDALIAPHSPNSSDVRPPTPARPPVAPRRPDQPVEPNSHRLTNRRPPQHGQRQPGKTATIVAALTFAGAGAIVLIAIGILAVGTLNQTERAGTGSIRADGWIATVSPAGSELNFSEPIPINDIGQTVYHQTTGSKFSISCFRVSPEELESGLDEFLLKRFDCEMIRTESILREGLLGVKQISRARTNGMVLYHELFLVDKTRLLLLTYVCANELEKAGLGQSIYSTSTETMSIDRAEHFFDSLSRQVLW